MRRSLFIYLFFTPLRSVDLKLKSEIRFVLALVPHLNVQPQEFISLWSVMTECALGLVPMTHAAQTAEHDSWLVVSGSFWPALFS